MVRYRISMYFDILWPAYPVPLHHFLLHKLKSNIINSWKRIIYKLLKTLIDFTYLTKVNTIEWITKVNMKICELRNVIM